MEKNLLFKKTLWHIMRLTFVQMILMAVFCSMAYAHDTKAQEILNKGVSIKAQSETLKTILAQIEKQTNARFVYSDTRIPIEKQVSVEVNGQSLETVLKGLLHPLSIRYQVSGNYIVLSKFKTEVMEKTSVKEILAPAFIVTGTVTDEKGEPLLGTSVVLEGTTKGTLTDENGKYTLELDDADKNGNLIFSFVGFDKQTVPITGRNTINIVLSEGKALEQVVVVGYGTQKKSDITGSVASLSRERLEQLPNANLAQALQGSIPGLQINTNSAGAEGNSNSILIRGRNSISASNTPLIVWDGIPYGGGFSEINPNDVESVEVLKDASAAAIYGARGSNGVILITSKKGKKGKLNITYDGFYGVQNTINEPELLSGPEFYEFKKARLNVPANVMTLSEQAVFDAGKWVNWHDLATQQGTRNQQTLAVSGGSDKMSFYIGGTYLNVQGIALNDQFKRYTLRPNLDIKVTPWLTISSSTQLSFQDKSGNPADFSGEFGANRMNPLTTPYNADGKPAVYAWPENNSVGNPLGRLLEKDKENSYGLFSTNSLKIDFPFLKGLSYRLNTGFELDNDVSRTYEGLDTKEGFENRGVATNSYSLERNFTVENIVAYNRDFGKHGINFTALYSSQSNDYDRDQLQGQAFPNDVLTNYQMNAAELLSPSSSYFKQNLLSQMARLNYAYDSRYLLTLTARRDGFSGFGTNSKYGIFPSIAFGWNIAKEPFMKNIKAINNLKLRGSYGVNGNQGVDAYQSLATLSTRRYLNGSTVLVGYIPNRLANEELGWESTTSTTLGLDFGLFNDRLQGTLDVYSGNTQDLLLNRNISSVQGFTRILQNIGKTANKGIELGITSTNFNKNGFKWTTNFNIAHNQNRIVDLYGDGRDDVGNGWFIGKPINTIFDLQHDGIFRSQAELDASAQKTTAKLGYVRVKDVNGDGVINTSTDRTFLGNEDPRFVFGMSNTFKYKGLSLMVFLQGTEGVTKENPLLQDGVYSEVRRNTTKKDWWSPSNPNGTHHINDAFANDFNADIYEDASFIRLKDVSLAYDLPTSVLKRMKLNKLKIYVTGRNLATFTKFKGLDPELSNQLGIPLQREFIFGLNVGL